MDIIFENIYLCAYDITIYMLDTRIVLFLLMILLLICIISMDDDKNNKYIIDENKKQQQQQQQQQQKQQNMELNDAIQDAIQNMNGNVPLTNLDSDHAIFHKYDDSTDIAEDIHINNELFETFTDIVTNYSMMRETIPEKYVLIFLSTFHLFDMNYSYKTLVKLDKQLEDYPYVPNVVTFPVGNLHHNIQKAIITHITLQIYNSERDLVNNREKDREIIRVYLEKLYQSIGIM
jgi:hypothetical protein